MRAQLVPVNTEDLANVICLTSPSCSSWLCSEDVGGLLAKVGTFACSSAILISKSPSKEKQRVLTSLHFLGKTNALKTAQRHPNLDSSKFLRFTERAMTCHWKRSHIKELDYICFLTLEVARYNSTPPILQARNLVPVEDHYSHYSRSVLLVLLASCYY